MKNPVFLAHRGGWMPGRRENTTGAIERAANSGRFAYIELDVRRTRSNDTGKQTPIIIHDDTLDRLYEQYNIPKYKRHRVGQQVHNLSIDIIRSEEIEVTTLAEAMRTANGHPLNLEIKTSETLDAALEVIADMVDKYGEWSYEKIVISSFDWSILAEVKSREPTLGVAMLYGWKNLPRSFGRTYNTLGARWIGFNVWLAPAMSIVARLVDVPQRFAYSVNSKIAIQILTLFGVNGIFTDQIKMPDQFD